MGQANVSVSFDADSLDAAKTVIDGWTLSPGCRVSLSFLDMAPSGQTDDSGNIEPIPDPEEPPAAL